MTYSSTLLFLSVTLLLPSAAATAAPETDERSDLRVLFVGHDPVDPRVPFLDLAEERTYALYRERTGSFRVFLNRHFRDVRVVYGADYEVVMSDDVDVTLFDARPSELSPAGRVTDPVTGVTTYHRASYLPESFDRPALMISENSPLIGEPLGLKLDWL